MYLIPKDIAKGTRLVKGLYLRDLAITGGVAVLMNIIGRPLVAPALMILYGILSVLAGLYISRESKSANPLKMNLNTLILMFRQNRNVYYSVQEVKEFE